MEDLLEASFGGFVSLDLAWPVAGGGVVDELLLNHPNEGQVWHDVASEAARVFQRHLLRR
jgi:hypothetical protein